MDVRHDPARTASARELSVTTRTVLLHHMLVLRRLGTLTGSRRPPGTEGVVAGVGAALAPTDALLVVGSAPPPAADTGVPDRVTVQLAHFAGHGRPERICAQFSHPHRGRIRRTVAAAGWDVEAVLSASTAAALAARTRESAQLVSMPLSSARRRYDPIAVLAARMRLARQLDDNAYRAIDADARCLAARLLITPPQPGMPDTSLYSLAMTVGRLAPCFLPARPTWRVPSGLGVPRRPAVHFDVTGGGVRGPGTVWPTAR
ncbi:hypothetical protein [Actinoplanes sp. NBRC 101535]|uniref:hypothetical protein n=1 Tax=Actinoplanes sp. NBRC 101535 TaxID=3032196 RepID=UPI0024A12F6D|nr:hypothetical protein [Actinoplanes sp. NBRC 101535]GLY08730.1 hypothetical protein Acsp01_91090 [Actinoplanes sp. NBRC 101535]